MPPAPLTPPPSIPEPPPPPLPPHRKRWPYIVGIPLFLIVAFVALNVLSNNGTPTTAEVSTAPLKYLLFQELMYSPAPRSVITDKASREHFIDQLTGAIGQTGDHVHTQLGFSVGPLALDMTDQQLRDTIDNAFAAAEEKNVAVALHIDDSYFWNSRQALWSNAQNVEWSDWQGTVNQHRIVGWVQNSAPILAPMMCYNAPAIKAEATRIARDVIGAEIKKNTDRLAAEGKEYLFAGVIATWEIRTSDDSQTPIGYCALHNLGYSATNPPQDANGALNTVARDWEALWGKSLGDAGIPKSKVFLHVPYADLTTDQIANLTRKLKYTDPSIVSFTDYTNPGFSVYGSSIPSSLHTLLRTHNVGAWGISEGTSVDVDPNSLASGNGAASMQQYLAGVFNYGGTYVNLFGWGGSGGFSQTTQGTDAIAAYKKFLSGESLQE